MKKTITNVIVLALATSVGVGLSFGQEPELPADFKYKELWESRSGAIELSAFTQQHVHCAVQVLFITYYLEGEGSENYKRLNDLRNTLELSTQAVEAIEYENGELTWEVQEKPPGDEPEPDTRAEGIRQLISEAIEKSAWLEDEDAKSFIENCNIVIIEYVPPVPPVPPDPPVDPSAGSVTVDTTVYYHTSRRIGRLVRWFRARRCRRQYVCPTVVCAKEPKVAKSVAVDTPPNGESPTEVEVIGVANSRIDLVNSMVARQRLSVSKPARVAETFQKQPRNAARPSIRDDSAVAAAGRSLEKMRFVSLVGRHFVREGNRKDPHLLKRTQDSLTAMTASTRSMWVSSLDEIASVRSELAFLLRDSAFAAIRYAEELGVTDYEEPTVGKQNLATTMPEFRTWTSANGKFTVEAMLVSADKNVVTLQRRDNDKLINVPLQKLSVADRELLTGERFANKNDYPSKDA